MQHLLYRLIRYGVTVPRTLLAIVVPMGESSPMRRFDSQYISKTNVLNNDGDVESIIHLLITDNIKNPYATLR